MSLRAAPVFAAFAASLLAFVADATAQYVPPAGTPPPTNKRAWIPKRDPLPAPEVDREWFFGLDARGPILKGEPASFNPSVGLGVGVHFGRAYRPWFRLRFAVDHDRIFSRRSIELPGLGFSVSRSQNLTTTSFLGQAVFRLPYRWFAAHLSLGGGLYLGFFNNAETDDARKIERTTLVPGMRAEAGFSFRIHTHWELGVAFGYDYRREQTRVPITPLVGAETRRVFDDQMSMVLRADYLF